MSCFRTEKGERVDLIEYTRERLKENPDLRIYIGSDSQIFKKNTRFVTCICFRNDNKGAHYIYCKEKTDRISVSYTRLYNEGLKTMEALSLFDGTDIKIEAVEFDYNDVKETISTKLVNDFKGWAEALGHKAIFKGGDMVACKAADHLCRN